MKNATPFGVPWLTPSTLAIQGAPNPYTMPAPMMIAKVIGTISSAAIFLLANVIA